MRLDFFLVITLTFYDAIKASKNILMGDFITDLLLGKV